MATRKRNHHPASDSDFDEDDHEDDDSAHHDHKRQHQNEDHDNDQHHERHYVHHEYHDYSGLSGGPVVLPALAKKGRGGVSSMFPTVLHHMLDDAEKRGFANIVSTLLLYSIQLDGFLDEG